MAERPTTTAGRLLGPSHQALGEFGEIAQLTWATIIAAVVPPYPYGRELMAQVDFALRLTWFPMIVVSFAAIYGPAGVQAGEVLKLFGAYDRLGSFYVLVVIRELAPAVCAIVMAGVAGTAMCADLGARKIREELDALAVLGVEPVKNLVVPRLLALLALTALFDAYAILFGMLSGLLLTVENGQPAAVFLATFQANATTLELAASLAKTLLYGGIIAIVSCYMGMTASGGPEGVGRAVNRAVVIAFLGVGTLDYAFTQTLLATNPVLSQVR